MNVFGFCSTLVDDYASYIRSLINIRDERIHEEVEAELESGLLWPEPLIQLNPSFEPDEWIDELVTEGVLHPQCSRVFRLNKNQPDKEKPLSLYFKTHRQHYYDLLQKVRTDGDWEAWLRFFLRGVMETSNQAVEAARAILELFRQDRQRIEGLGRAAGSALRVHELLQQRPLLTIPQAEQTLSLTKPTIASALENLQHMGIVRELTGKQRYRIYVYDRYFNILDEGTEPLPR